MSEDVGLFWELCSKKFSLQVRLGRDVKEGRDQAGYGSVGRGFQVEEKARCVLFVVMQP